MNQDNDRQNEADIDRQVSDHFNALSDERTPPHLDQAVMREAKRAVRTDNRRGSFGAWFRPVAFMAMVGLSLAIILDLSNTGVVDLAPDPQFESMPAAPAQRAIETQRRDRSQAALSELKRQEKSPAGQPQAEDGPAMNDDVAGIATAADATGPDQGRQSKLQSAPLAESNEPVDAPTANADASEAFSAESRNVLERLENMEVSREAASPPQPSATSQFAPQDAAGYSMSIVTPVECSVEQKATAEEWWTCIKMLREAGQAQAANAEFENLRKDFPDFAPPE